MVTNPPLQLTSSSKFFDVLVIADVTRKGDAGLRIRREIESYFDMGLRVGIFHVPIHKKGNCVSPDIQLCVMDKKAEIIPADLAANGRLAIIYSPGLLVKPTNSLRNLRADKVVLVIDRKPELRQMGRWFSFNIGPVSWAPTNRWIRAEIAAMGMPVRLEDEDWRTIARPALVVKPWNSVDRNITVGRVSAPGAAQWPKTRKELKAAYFLAPHYDFQFMGSPPANLTKQFHTNSNWKNVNFSHISIDRFIGMIDVFAYFPSAALPELPEAAISTAMASGKVILLPHRMKPHFGPGAIYADADQLATTIDNLINDETALKEAREATAHHSKFQFSDATHREKVSALLGDIPTRKPILRKKAPTKPRVLFVPSNGVGLGHVTRLLAIARRIDPDIEPIFATLAQAIPIIESFGYTTEYIPSQSDVGDTFSKWDAWLKYQLGELIDRYDATTVVFDGNNPTLGLMNAVLSRGRCRLVWVRRGMLGPTPSPYLENSKFMDLIIEPGEIAGERDRGSTAARRGEAYQVAPVTLLDRNELLSREMAIRELGLSTNHPAVLVQLGAGANRDNVALVDQIIPQLKKTKNLQIVLAEWENGFVEFPNWPSTRLLRGYPISKYFNAFNFSISASGYNTYHEIIGFGLPSIFIANRHPQLDDQQARAEFAQDHQLGFNLPDDQLYHLPALGEAMLNNDLRQVMHQRCLEISGNNGATCAASAILELTKS